MARVRGCFGCFGAVAYPQASSANSDTEGCGELMTACARPQLQAHRESRHRSPPGALSTHTTSPTRSEHGRDLDGAPATATRSTTPCRSRPEPLAGGRLERGAGRTLWKGA